MIKAVKSFFIYLSGILTGIGFGALGLAIFAIIDRDPSRKAGYRRPYVSYNNYIKRPFYYQTDRDEAKQIIQDELDDLNKFDSEEVCDSIIDSMNEIIANYGKIRMYEFFNLIGHEPEYERDRLYGWIPSDLSDAVNTFKRADGYYSIDLPEIRRLD